MIENTSPLAGLGQGKRLGFLKQRITALSGAEPGITTTPAHEDFHRKPHCLELATKFAGTLLQQCDALDARLRQTRTLGAHLLDSTLQNLLTA